MSTTGAQATAQNQTVNQLKSQDLVAGDIIATRNHSAGSRGIRLATGGSVSHAILYTGSKLGSHWAVDATTDQGVTRELLHQKISSASYAVAFRSNTATSQQCAKACSWAELQAQMSKQYDFKTAARVGKPTRYTSVGRLIILADNVEAWLNPEGHDASFMCSELVFRSFEVAGAPLIDKPAHNLSPSMVFRTKRLNCLGRLV